ncbi:hypothetical protein AAMO2058_001031600 [Amorphochlora amoebiformis]
MSSTALATRAPKRRNESRQENTFQPPKKRRKKNKKSKGKKRSKRDKRRESSNQVARNKDKRGESSDQVARKSQAVEEKKTRAKPKTDHVYHKFEVRTNRLESQPVRELLPNMLTILQDALLSRDWQCVANAFIALDKVNEQANHEMFETLMETHRRFRPSEKLLTVLERLGATPYQHARRIALEIAYHHIIEGKYSAASEHLRQKIAESYFVHDPEAQCLIGISRFYRGVSLSLKSTTKNSDKSRKRVRRLLTDSMDSFARSFTIIMDRKYAEPSSGPRENNCEVDDILAEGVPIGLLCEFAYSFWTDRKLQVSNKAVRCAEEVLIRLVRSCCYQNVSTGVLEVRERCSLTSDPHIIRILLRIHKHIYSDEDHDSDEHSEWSDAETTTSDSRNRLRSIHMDARNIAKRLFKLDPMNDDALGLLIGEMKKDLKTPKELFIDLSILCSRIDISPDELTIWMEVTETIEALETKFPWNIRLDTITAYLKEHTNRLNWWKRSARHLDSRVLQHGGAEERVKAGESLENLIRSMNGALQQSDVPSFSSR